MRSASGDRLLEEPLLQAGPHPPAAAGAGSPPHPGHPAAGQVQKKGQVQPAGPRVRGEGKTRGNVGGRAPKPTQCVESEASVK